jgi:hypothetical protein
MLLLCVAFTMPGCKGGERRDTVLSSLASPSRKYRATIVQRQFYVDGKTDSGPTTFVLVGANEGSAKYGNGEDINESEVAMKPTQCGPLSLEWVNDQLLRVRCEQCGLSLASAGPHASSIGAVRIEYDGFPEVSSWEGGGSH